MRSRRGPGFWVVVVGLWSLPGVSEGQAVRASELLKATPQSCDALGSTYVFRVASLSCVRCPDGQVASADGFECRCGENGREQIVPSTNGLGPVLSCFDCSAQLLTVTQDRQSCIPCGNLSAGNLSARNLSAGNLSAVRRDFEDFEVWEGGGEFKSREGGARSLLQTAATCSSGFVPSGEDSAGRCTCPVGHVLSDFNSSGAVSVSQGKFCTPCPFNSYVKPQTPTVCTPCPDPYMRRNPFSGVCECTGGRVEDSLLVAGATPEDVPYVGLHVCIDQSTAVGLNVAPNTYAAQTFYNAIDVDGARKDSHRVDRSLPFMQHFLAAATRCTSERHWRSCQALANLCVLALYDGTNPACRIFNDLQRPIVTKDVNGFQGWAYGFPWLLYDQSTREVLESTALNRRVALSGPDSLLNLTLTVYHLNGSYAGMQRVSTQLLLCPGDERELARFVKFGSNTQVTCRLDLQKLTDEYAEPMFYELWMEDNLNGDGSVRSTGPALYPVPVIISNYRSGSDTPNQVLSVQPNLELGVGAGGDAAIGRVVVYRRFFLWDNVSGRRLLDAASRARAQAAATRHAPADTSDAVVVRWAKYMELRIKLQRDDPSTPTIDESLRVYPPYLFIEYDQQMVSTIPQETLPINAPLEFLRYPSVSFRSSYTMDLANFWYVSMILFIVLVILVVIAFGIKVSMRNQSFSLSPPDGMLVDLLGAVADAFFWGLFVMCGYWFFFFKLQSEVKVLLPLNNPHPDYLIIVITCIVCKILQVLLLVYRQCTVDVFFIDWEKERATDDKPMLGGPADKDRAMNSNVSVWRSILIANEWCEMQGHRHTDIDFTLMFLLLFMAGLRFQYLATPQPDSQDLSEGTLNLALRFFTIAMWYFTVVLIQVVWKVFSYRFIQDPLDLFVDLCQLANISTFILDEKFHGYYIHGRAVHPYTDVNMYTMQTNLQAESDGNLPYRGLTQRSRDELNGASDQVFEMYITEKIRDEYNNQFARLVPGGANTRGKGGKADRNAELISRAYHSINLYLQTNVVDEIVSAHASEVLPPSIAHKVIGMPPPKIREHPVLLRDNAQLFARTLFYGIEYDLVIFDLVIFIMWDLIFGDVFIAALLTYVVAHALIELRCTWGSSNVATKTLVDARFLV